MRVVAGSLRGRRIEPPPDRRARPTSDRVREAAFNALASMGVIEGAGVLDLFAGTGALGIEALSRGADHATFVEHDHRMLAVLRRNIAALGLGTRATVVPRRAAAVLEEWRTSNAEFDLALLDPPYAFDGWVDLLAVVPAGTALIESAHAPTLPEPWGVVREKRYGSTLLTIVQRSERSSQQPRTEHRRGDQ